MLGLYEWSKDKTSAIRQKADDLEAGRRDRSPTASPDPYGSDSDGGGGGRQEISKREEEQSRRKKVRAIFIPYSMTI